MKYTILWGALAVTAHIAPCKAELPDFTDALVEGHVDGVAVGYSGAWTLGIDDKSVAPLASYSPDTTILVARPESRTTRPPGSQWDFLGTPAGGSLWLLPQNAASNRLFLGTNAEGVPSGTLAAYSEPDSRVTGLPAPWVTLRIADVRGPGEMSIWTNGAGGQPTIWVSTSDGGLSGSDKLIFLEGGHAHWNWGFTELGVYEVDVVVSGYVNDGGPTLVSSEPVTYYFGVEHSKAGDANLDGEVTGADYTIWADHFLQHAGDALFTQADFNGDGLVTGADYTLWADHFDDLPEMAVPEPSGAWLGALGLAWLAGAWKKSKAAPRV